MYRLSEDRRLQTPQVPRSWRKDAVLQFSHAFALRVPSRVTLPSLVISG